MVTHIRINDMENPVGFSLEPLKVSYWLGKKSGKHITATIYTDVTCQTPVYRQKLDPKRSFCTILDFKPAPETRYYLKIQDGEESEAAFFESGTDFKAAFITPEAEVSHPIVFRRFSLTGTVRWARAYITGLGLYEAYLNQEKIGNEYLTPNCNDYDEYVQYQTYDITKLLQDENVIEILLGDGWYKGRFGLKNRDRIYGNRYEVAAQIVISYEDGHRDIISTDESWNAKASCILSSGIYDGEYIDYNVRDKIFGVIISEKTHHVVPRNSLPIVEKYVLKPKLMISPKGERILDFGQNFAGFVRFRCHLRKGEKIVLTAGEVLQGGCFYRDNLRSAKAQFVCVSDGSDRIVRPHFTYYGFRYMLVEGANEVCVEDFEGVVLFSDLEETVTIHTDNEKLDRLLQNCMWSQRSNFIDIPTDCPQRDERLGWTGDAEVFSATACYQMHSKVFYEKYLKDVEIDQVKYGTVTTYSPAMKEGDPAGSVWGDVATILPWNLYQFYGDEKLLEKHYPMMRRYVERIIKEDDARGGKRIYDFGFHLGDWLAQDGASPNAMKGATDEYFIASVYYYNSVSIVAKAARVIGASEDAANYSAIAREIKKAILKEYFSPSGKLCVDTQTAYILCLSFDIYRNKYRLISDFSQRLKRDCYRVKGGFVGATQMIQALFGAGMKDEAFRILFNEQYPGWLACVDLGATTIWERWNSLNADGSISSTGMNSLNHYSYGSVAEAIYAYVIGLRPLSPAFKKVVIEPNFDHRLKCVDFTFDSPSGKYEISYSVKRSRIHCRLVIPEGAQAILVLKGHENRRLGAGCHTFDIPCGSEDLKYSLETPVCDLLASETTREILKRNLPTLTAFLTYSDMGLNGETLKTITEIPTFAVPPEKLDLVKEELSKIK